MNAYDIAKDLDREGKFPGHVCYGTSPLLVRAANMLRKQADRIAELEKLLEHSVGSDCREMRYIQEIENKDARIAELEKDLEGCEYFLNKTKPLSDGVILNSIPHPRNDGYVPEELNSDSLEMVEIDLSCVLTIDEIHNLFGITALNPTVTLTWEQCEKIARAIEERHGIK